jgi:aryl-alcohol dehydrogenase-like predicted oxidoreductase
VQAALDQGVNYFDMQPDYGDAELYLAPIIRRHRDGLFLVTKTGEKSKTGVLESVRGSLDRLGVDRIDAVMLNNIGDYRLDEVFGKEGALAGLMEARRRGQARSFGISGHYQPEHFARCLETGEFDIAMAPFNFVDRFIYSFEQEILSVAAKHDVGVVAMKVFGGAVGLRYNTREQKALLAADEHKLSVRYALSLPGVCSAVIGCKSTSEVSIAANLGRTYCPLRGAELASTQARGKQLASHWGRHYPEG